MLMEGQEKQNRREDIFSKAVRAGKRTYFFDVKATRNDQYYLTITESKRRFLNEQGKFFYEKHKIFLYKEDFEKFVKGLDAAIRFIETGEVPEGEIAPSGYQIPEETKTDIDLSFDDLGKDDAKTPV
ncbi:MAG: DNA-binding protein [bacterium]|nr:MAG: DNA-binding protein [bacterium]